VMPAPAFPARPLNGSTLPQPVLSWQHPG
jgi:hypothetical protein